MAAVTTAQERDVVLRSRRSVGSTLLETSRHRRYICHSMPLESRVYHKVLEIEGRLMW